MIMKLLNYIRGQRGGMSGRTIFFGTVLILVLVLSLGLVIAVAAVASLGDQQCKSESSQGGGGTVTQTTEGGPPVYFIGDSIGVNVVPMLGPLVGGKVTGQVTGSINLHDSIPKIEGDKQAIKDAKTVVIELGTNTSGNFGAEAKELVNKIRAINPDAKIYWVQIFSDGQYADENTVISGLQGVEMIQTKDQMKSYLTPDGIHLNPDGYKKLSQIIATAVKSGASDGGGGDSAPNTEDSPDCPPAGGVTGDFSGDCTATGVAYVSQPGEAGLTKQFGAAGDAGAGKQQTMVSLLGGTVQVHKKIAPCVEAVERERKAAGINYPITSGIGGYRSSDGQIGNASFHVYGAAIDVNPETNPYCNGGSVVGNPAYCGNPEIPMSLVKIFRKYGFYWGGDYTSLKDYMHFEWHGEKP